MLQQAAETFHSVGKWPIGVTHKTWSLGPNCQDIWKSTKQMLGFSLFVLAIVCLFVWEKKEDSDVFFPLNVKLFNTNYPLDERFPCIKHNFTGWGLWHLPRLKRENVLMCSQVVLPSMYLKSPTVNATELSSWCQQRQGEKG